MIGIRTPQGKREFQKRLSAKEGPVESVQPNTRGISPATKIRLRGNETFLLKPVVSVTPGDQTPSGEMQAWGTGSREIKPT